VIERIVGGRKAGRAGLGFTGGKTAGVTKKNAGWTEVQPAKDLTD